MANDGVVDVADDESRIVTEFLLGTCRLRQPSNHNVSAASLCSVFSEIVKLSDVDDEIDYIPLTTGSSAEFYIQPMLPYVGDIDIMHHSSDQLAIPDGYPPPTELPAEFHSRVEVYEIIDSEYRGYVYLMSSYLLTEDCDGRKYNAIKNTQRRCMLHGSRQNSLAESHGPAETVYNDTELSFDGVYCVRCLLWPPQADYWALRHRSYGWPDSATVDSVVSNGCDVVQVAHRQCRQDERMSVRQWRLSFSRAEVVLINSWIPVQQIVYHMLRVFVKTERLTDTTDGTETKLFSNYHLKTLMMWASELKPQSWWTDNTNAVRICVKLLHILAD